VRSRAEIAPSLGRMIGTDRRCRNKFLTDWGAAARAAAADNVNAGADVVVIATQFTTHTLQLTSGQLNYSITLPIYYRMQVRFCFLVASVTFLFVLQISPELLNGLVPNSQERHASSLTRAILNVHVTRDKSGKTAASLPLIMHCKACAVHCKRCHPAADGTIASQLGVTGVHTDGGLCAVYVW